MWLWLLRDWIENGDREIGELRKKIGNTYNSRDAFGITGREAVTSKMGNLGPLAIL